MTAPRSRRTTFEEAVDHIGAESVVWVRLAAICDADAPWTTRLCELTSGPEPPPSWESCRWEYAQARFEARVESGETVAGWLRAKQVVLDDGEYPLPDMAAQVTWERHQSGAPGAYETVAWPVSETTLSQMSSWSGDPQGHLVSATGAPSFVNFYTAAACFFWLDRQPSGGSLHQGVAYRYQDDRGRITQVTVGADETTVTVEGRALDGMVVELAGDHPGPRERVLPGKEVEECTVRLPLEDGLPVGAWILLRSADEWIDRRFVTVPWVRDDQADVEFLVEPSTKLEAFLANREGTLVEFKREYPGDDEAKAKTMKTVCAFANGQGGSILFGIDDDHNVVGVPRRAADRLQDQLTQVVGSWLEPRPRFAFEILPTEQDELVVLELRVAPGIRLYGCGRPGDPRVVHVRHHATSVRARPGEIEEIVRARNPEATMPPWAARERRDLRSPELAEPEPDLGLGMEL